MIRQPALPSSRTNIRPSSPTSDAQTGGRRVQRNVLAAEQVDAIARKLEEPYATLVLLLFVTGLRIGEAAALKLIDLQGNVLTVSRRIYKRSVGEVKSLRSVRKLVLGPDMVARIGALQSRFANSEWMFQSEVGTPIDPRKALNRYYRPAAAACGITVSGWHDFRHTLSTNLRRNKQHPKVISDILGHSKVNLAMDVYDRTDLQDVSTALATVSQLLPSVAKFAVVQ
jgi:integrase